jgi:hypothetical protein
MRGLEGRGQKLWRDGKFEEPSDAARGELIYPVQIGSGYALVLEGV